MQNKINDVPKMSNAERSDSVIGNHREHPLPVYYILGTLQFTT